MSTEIARILAYGDLHLSSKNYGAHFDYPNDSLNSLKLVTEYAKSFNATHIIGLGDLTYGRFNNLEYRSAVEKELEAQYLITNGNRYELKGNHDTASYGMTEYEYYVLKGLLKPAVNFDIGNFHISMINYGEYNKQEPNIILSDNDFNFLFMHDYCEFKDTFMPNYGNPLLLDNFERWYGVDNIVGGHIHNNTVFEGYIISNNKSHNTIVDYLGSMSRPAYREDHTDTVGHMLELTLYDNSTYNYNRLDIDLPPLDKVFNLAAKEEEVLKNTFKRQSIDISDVIGQLNSHKGDVGDAEFIISSLIGVDERYKKRALELLQMGNA